MVNKTGLAVLFAVFLSSGCSSFNKIDTSNLKSLSNDNLCRSLGENNDNGNLVLKIHGELINRGGSVNNERCYALEKTYRNDTGMSITPTVTQSTPERVFDNKKGKYITKESVTKAGLDIHFR